MRIGATLRGPVTKQLQQFVERRPFWKDVQFWLAVIAAFIVWSGMVLLLPPVWQPWWPLVKPGHYLQLVLLYPVVEEIIFRGMIQGRLRQTKWGLITIGPLTMANFVASLLFTMIHFVMHPPLAAIAVLAPSLVFGYLRDRTGILSASIAIHCFYNAGYYWLYGSGLN